MKQELIAGKEYEWIEGKGKYVITIGDWHVFEIKICSGGVEPICVNIRKTLTPIESAEDELISIIKRADKSYSYYDVECILAWHNKHKEK